VTGLLVSVRSASEAEAALRGGATLIDVKEPRHGPLGRATATQWSQVAAAVAQRVPVSVACGELAEADGNVLAAVPASVSFAKCGLAGCAALSDWPQRWRVWAERLPPQVAPVAVLYADWRAAGAPDPAEVLRYGAACRCPALLCDTWAKDGRTLLEHLTPAALRTLTRTARRCGMRIVLAGSLQLRDLHHVLALEPDFVAVRGAVCQGGRTGRVQAERVAQFAHHLVQAARPREAAGLTRGTGRLDPPRESARLLDISRAEFDT
jgi:hypothetical protein